MKKRKILSCKEIDEIILKYLEGFSSGDLSNEYSVTPQCIIDNLKRRNINRRNVSDCHKKYTINEIYFEKIDTEDKSYFLGFMFADGYNDTDKSVASITLHPDDVEILNLFNKKLGSNKPLRNDRGYVRLVMENKKISMDLAKLGCVKAKTHILKFPKLKKNMIRHFIRGYFDGDGCITWSKNKLIPQFSIVGNEIFLIKIQNILIEELGLSKTKFIKRHKERGNDITTLIYGSYGNCIKIYHYLYDKSNVYFIRKKNKFEKIFKLLNINYGN